MYICISITEEYSVEGREEKNGEEEILYIVDGRTTVKKSSSDICLLQFSRTIRCSRREKKNAIAPHRRFFSVRKSMRFQRDDRRCRAKENDKIVPNKINRFRRRRHTDELGKFAAVQRISGSCLTRASLGCPLRLRNVNAATQITRRAATLAKFAEKAGEAEGIWLVRRFEKGVFEIFE